MLFQSANTNHYVNADIRFIVRTV